MSEHLRRARRALEQADSNHVSAAQMYSLESIAYSLLAIAEELCLPKVVLKDASATSAWGGESLLRPFEEE